MNSMQHKVSTRKSTVDPVQVQRNLLIGSGFLGTVLVAAFTIKTGQLVFMLGFVILPFALMLMNKPSLALVLALILDATGIPLPGVSGGTLGLAAKLLLIGTAILGIMMGQRGWKGAPLSEKRPLLCLSAIILLLMVVRGSGLRMLGSETWGGMMYIIFLVGILFYFLVNGLELSRKQIRMIVWGSLIAGLVGTLIGRLGWLGSHEMQNEVGAGRLRWLIPVASALFPLVFVLRFKRMWWVVSALLLLFCLTLIGLTGFRSRLVGMMAVAVGCSFFLARNKIRYMFLLAVVGLCCWGGVVAVSPKLPTGLQRAVSFVPGVNIDRRVANDAENSIEWRVEIWKYCIGQAKEYIWIGRGSAFNIYETTGDLGVNDVAQFSPWFAFQTRSYHSGPLTLLIDYGLPGLVVGIWLAVVVSRRLWRTALRLSEMSSFESRYAVFLCVSLLWSWFSYFFVYGDIRKLASMVASTAVAVVIAESVFAEREKEHELVAVDENSVTHYHDT